VRDMRERQERCVANVLRICLVSDLLFNCEYSSGGNVSFVLLFAWRASESEVYFKIAVLKRFVLDCWFYH